MKRVMLSRFVPYAIEDFLLTVSTGRTDRLSICLAGSPHQFTTGSTVVTKGQ